MGELQSNSPGHSGSRAGVVYAIAMVAAFSEFIRGYDLSVISGELILLVSEFEL